MNIIITGSGGVLGRALSDELKAHGSHIVSLHHSAEELEAVLKEYGESITGIVHCAFSRKNDPIELTRSLDFTGRVFTLSKMYRIRRVVNISSQSVYSASKEDIWDEGTEAAPGGMYEMAKYATELLGNAIFQGTDIQYTSLRLASLIGPGMDQRVVTKFISMILQGEEITLPKPGQKFQYLDIRDAAKGIAALLKTDEWENKYNVAPQKQMTLKEISEIVGSVMKEKGYLVKPVICGLEKSAAQGYLSSSSFRKLTGWTEEYDLKNTTEAIEEYLRLCR